MKINNVSLNFIQQKKPEMKANAGSFKGMEQIATVGDMLDLSNEVTTNGSALNHLWENILGPKIDTVGKFIVDVLPDYTVLLMLAGVITSFSDDPSGSGSRGRH